MAGGRKDSKRRFVIQGYLLIQPAVDQGRVMGGLPAEMSEKCVAFQRCDNRGSGLYGDFIKFHR
jgi:hypothetical protein